MKTPTIEEIKGVIDDYILLFENLLSKAELVEEIAKIAGSKKLKNITENIKRFKIFLGFFYMFKEYLETGEMPESLDPVMEVINNLKESINHA